MNRLFGRYLRWCIVVMLEMFLGACGSESRQRINEPQASFSDGWELHWVIPEGIATDTPMDVHLVMTVPMTLTNQSLALTAEGNGQILSPSTAVITPTIIANQVYTQTLSVVVPDGEYLRVMVLFQGYEADGTRHGNGGEFTLETENGVVYRSYGNPLQSPHGGFTEPFTMPYPIVTPWYLEPTPTP